MLTTIFLILCVVTGFVPAQHSASAAVITKSDGGWSGTALLQVRETHAQPRQVNNPTSSCLPGVAIATPTLTPSPTPTPIPTRTGTPTPGPSPTPTPVPTIPGGFTPTPTVVPIQTQCAVSAQPPLAFNELGNQHTFTFLCGNAVTLLPGPTANPAPSTGCFDVQASVVDISEGVDVPISAASCGPFSAAISTTASCAGTYNPICAAGTTASNGTCLPVCPTGAVILGTTCTVQPVNGACPSGSSPVTNSSGGIAYCTVPANSTPTINNEVTVTFSSGAPHAFLVQFTGFLPTRADGTCPQGTTFVASALLASASNTSPGYSGPACAFTVGAEKKYLEANDLTIHPQGACGAVVGPGEFGLQEAAPCFFTVSAAGQVILKSGVNCADGSEPATGTDATGAGFPTGSTFSCSGGVLAVVNIPMSNVPIRVTATNGFFSPICFPPERLVTPTATPEPGTATETPTATPSATDTPTIVPSPTPLGTPPPFYSETPLCGPPGVSFLDTFTTSANPTPPIVTYSVAPTSAVVTEGGDATIRGVFVVDGSAISGVDMFVTVHYPGGDRFCSALTLGDGTAECSTNTDSTPPGTKVAVDVQFQYDCAEFTASTSFVVGGPGTPTPVAAPRGTVNQARGPTGICVVRSGYGDLVVEASARSTTNTQPPLSSGPFTLGAFGVPTATPAPTATETLVPTNTPVPTATNTPVPIAEMATPTETPPPTDTATPAPPTATPAPTSAPRLTWEINAARVQKKGSLANMKGMKTVHRGQTVWLFVYYTVTRAPKKMSFYSTYAVFHGSSRVRSKTYKGTQNKNGTGRFGRYDDWTALRTQPLGRYTFKASLQFGKKKKTATWTFNVVR